jgi:hypothetical protein
MPSRDSVFLVPCYSALQNMTACIQLQVQRLQFSNRPRNFEKSDERWFFDVGTLDRGAVLNMGQAARDPSHIHANGFWPSFSNL